MLWKQAPRRAELCVQHLSYLVKQKAEEAEAPKPLPLSPPELQQKTSFLNKNAPPPSCLADDANRGLEARLLLTVAVGSPRPLPRPAGGLSAQHTRPGCRNEPGRWGRARG